MRYNPLPKQLYVKNRKKLSEKLAPNSVVILQSNDIMPTNADGTMGFRQNNDLLYLSGIDQEESIVLLYPDSKDNSLKEVLFLRETSPEIAIWEGARLTKEEAEKLSGIQNIQWTQNFASVLKTIMAEVENVYLQSNEHTRRAAPTQTRFERFAAWCKENYPLHQYKRLAPAINRLRAIKEPEEAEAIQQACDITKKGFLRILPFVKPGVKEYAIQAEMLHEFLNNRSRGFAYDPIIASGFDSCVLHYVANNKTCQNGDILLMDTAAEYANYASDLTRVIPINGKFTKRQKDVYNAVLQVQKKAMQLLKPGNTLQQVNTTTGEYVEKELVDLGLLSMDAIKKAPKNMPAYKKYFMHGTSHFMGLDVHDVGYFNEPIEAGMVFTCEPGIYIREENLGVRIENDIMVTKNGQHDFMSTIPREADEIEAMMNA